MTNLWISGPSYKYVTTGNFPINYKVSEHEIYTQERNISLTSLYTYLFYLIALDPNITYSTDEDKNSIMRLAMATNFKKLTFNVIDRKLDEYLIPELDSGRSDEYFIEEMGSYLRYKVDNANTEDLKHFVNKIGIHRLEKLTISKEDDSEYIKKIRQKIHILIQEIILKLK
jgi:hypothetical protein